MKRVLLTGGAGFIAHHTIKHFLENTDWEIVSLDRLDYSGNLNRTKYCRCLLFRSSFYWIKKYYKSSSY